MVTGAATTRFCVKTPAAEAGTSLERMAKSSAPVFFRPQAVAAKRKPRGSAASERACCITGRVMGGARRSRKGPPILREVRDALFSDYGWRAHGWAPVLIVNLVRRF